MFEKLQLTSMAQAMASQAGARLGIIAQNVANADTPGYKAADLPSFAETYAQGLDGDGAMPMRATRPGHFAAADAEIPAPVIHRNTAAGAPNGNSVSLEQEMVKAAQARQDHEMALAIYRNTSSIIRASLGRRG